MTERWTDSERRCECGTVIAVNNTVPNVKGARQPRVQSNLCFRCRGNAIRMAPIKALLQYQGNR